MFIQRMKPNSRGLWETVNSFLTNDVEDIVKEYALLEPLDNLTVVLSEGDIVLDFVAGGLTVYEKQTYKRLGRKAIIDIKNLTEFLETLVARPKIGNIDVFKVLLEEQER